jgi:hypothetical protein
MKSKKRGSKPRDEWKPCSLELNQEQHKHLRLLMFVLDPAKSTSILHRLGE